MVVSAKRRAVTRGTDADSDAESTGSTCEVGWMSEQVSSPSWTTFRSFPHETFFKALVICNRTFTVSNALTHLVSKAVFVFIRF